MNLHHIPDEHKDDILKMQWLQDLAHREYQAIGKLSEWLQDGNRGYEDIPPGLRGELFYKDLHSGEVHACALWKEMGYGEDEMADTKWQDLVHPDDQPAIRETFHNYAYKNNIRVGQSLFRAIDAAGVYQWLLSSSAVITRDSDGSIFRYVGRDVNVGERLDRELSLTRRIHEIEDRSAREKALMDAVNGIAGSTDENGLVNAINSAAVELFGLRKMRIILSDESGYRMVSGELPPDNFDWSMLDGMDPEKGTELPGSLHAWHLGDVAEGHALIAFANGDDPGPDADPLMKILGPIILGTWERVRHIDTLRKHATTDPLTGAWNRRAFLQQAGRSLRRACENGKTCTVAIMDIDHFKNVNDKFGHPFGDRVLVDVADGMNESLRSGDFMCRWGGEEFAFFLDEVDVGDAEMAVDRVRTAGGRSCIDTEHCVTLSAGFHVILPESHLSLETALQKADEGLMEAKKTGRNRTVEHSGK